LKRQKSRDFSGIEKRGATKETTMQGRHGAGFATTTKRKVTKNKNKTEKTEKNCQRGLGSMGEDPERRLTVRLETTGDFSIRKRQRGQKGGKG